MSDYEPHEVVQHLLGRDPRLNYLYSSSAHFRMSLDMLVQQYLPALLQGMANQAEQAEERRASLIQAAMRGEWPRPILYIDSDGRLEELANAEARAALEPHYQDLMRQQMLHRLDGVTRTEDLAITVPHSFPSKTAPATALGMQVRFGDVEAPTVERID